MTVYVLELTPTALRGLPSVQCRFELCKIIVKHILEHLGRVLLVDKPISLYELENQEATFVWCMDFLIGLATNTSSANPPVEVRNVYVRKRATRHCPAYSVGFDMATLAQVPPFILLIIMAELIRVSSAEIALLMPLNIEAIERAKILKTITRRVSTLCSLKGTGRPSGFLIRLQIEANDSVNAVTILAD